MTVTFLRPYASYSIGQSATFTADTEAALVQQGIANAVTVNTNVNAPFEAAENPAYNVIDDIRGVTALALRYPSLSAVIANVKARKSRAKLLIAGDSVPRGWGDAFATGPGTGTLPQPSTTNYANAYPTKLARILNAAGIPSRSDAFLASANVTSGAAATDIPAAYDNRVTLGAGWGVSSGAFTTGGRILSNGTDTTAFTYAPEVPARGFDLTGIFTSQTTVSDANGPLKLTDANGNDLGNAINMGAFVPQKVTATRLQNSVLPISIQRTGVGGGTFYLGQILPFNPEYPMLEILNGGGGGSSTSAWAQIPGGNAGPRAMLPFIRPDATIVDLGRNDANGGVPAATFQANLQAFSVDARAYGDVILAKPNRANGGNGTGFDVPTSYLTAIDAVAATINAAGILDYYALLGLITSDYFGGVGDPHLVSQGTDKYAMLTAYSLLSNI